MVVVEICVGIALVLVVLTALVLLSPRRGSLSGRDLERFEAGKAAAQLTSQQGHYSGFGL